MNQEKKCSIGGCPHSLTGGTATSADFRTHPMEFLGVFWTCTIDYLGYCNSEKSGLVCLVLLFSIWGQTDKRLHEVFQQFFLIAGNQPK